MRKNGKYLSIRIILNALILIPVMILLFTKSMASAEINKLTLNIDYFYYNTCGSCDKEQEFLDLFDKQLGDEKKDIQVNIKMHNVFLIKENELLQDYYEDYQFTEKYKRTPVLFLNNTYLIGSDEIEGQIKKAFLAEKSKIDFEHNKDFANSTEAAMNSYISYFFVSPCDACDSVKDFLKHLDNEYAVTLDGKRFVSELQVLDYNVDRPENVELIRRYFDLYKVPEKHQKTPIIFLKDQYLSGKEEIIEHLVNYIENGEAVGKVDALTLVQEKGVSTNKLFQYNLGTVILTGLMNGLNPCSISMLLFFISLLISSKGRAVKLGLCYIGGKFTAYLLTGTLLYNVFTHFSNTWMDSIQIIGKAILLIIVCMMILLNLHDSLSARKEQYNKIKLQLPEFLRKFNHQWIKKITNIGNRRWIYPFCFILGCVISAGEFLCTGQIFLVSLIIMAKTSSLLSFHPYAYLLIYMICSILPLLLLLFMIYKGKEMFDVTEFFRNKLPIVKMINALIFMIFAILIFLLF